MTNPLRPASQPSKNISRIIAEIFSVTTIALAGLLGLAAFVATI